MTQAFRTLVRRELGGYFLSSTGYMVIATVLVLLGMSFWGILEDLNVDELTDAPITEQFFVSYYYWMILLLTTPIITMRLFAQERSTGTYETLLTAPVRDLEVVLAKFTASLIFYLVTWLPLAIHLAIVRRYSNDPSVLSVATLLTTYLGIALVGSVFLALGCLASSLTRSQAVAAILSYGFNIGLFLLGMRAVTRSPSDGFGARLFEYISLTDHLERFARGIVDTRPLVFYLTFTVFILFLTHQAVRSQRWR